jgi:predicted PurR-regulated permease PerM
VGLPDTPSSLDADPEAPAGSPAQAGPWRPVGYFVLSLALTILGVWMLWDFLPALLWAAVLAIATRPLFERVVGTNPRRGSAAAAFTCLITLLFVVPLIVVAVDVGREGVAAVQGARSLQEQGIPQPEWLRHLPLVGGAASTWWQSHLADPGYATDLLGRIDRSVALEWTRILGTQVVHRLALFGFTLLTLFFLYRDGPLLVRQSNSVTAHLFGAAGIRLGQQMVRAVRATVNGLVLVGLGEGVVLGLGYALAGLAHSLLLGAVTAVLAMVPFGAPLVLAVGALILFGQDQTVAAVTLLVFGSVVIFAADHFVRPYFIGGAVRLPFLWVLLGILGGLEAFGLLGLFLGPAIMAAMVELWRDWAAGETARSEP